MPNTRKPSPTLDAFSQKSKPRSLSGLRPSHDVRPTPPALVTSTPSSSIPGASPLSTDTPSRTSTLAPTSPSTPQTSRPRKRFRKKVNGLFGEQTDLKKRMEKLLRDTDPAKLLHKRADDSCRAIAIRRGDAVSSAQALPPATVVVERLQQASTTFGIGSGLAEGPNFPLQSRDEAGGAEVMLDGEEKCSAFSSPALVATASRVLGSPEKLRAVQRTMGRLSPRSNERFVDELELGGSESFSNYKSSRRIAREESSGRITPPHLPRAQSLEFETEGREALQNAIMVMSPVSADRTGAPAVLRRKVRRSERGYRSADILRARLQGTSLAEIAASPTSQCREKPGRWAKVKGKRLDLSEPGGNESELKGVGRKRKSVGRLRFPSCKSTSDSDGMSSSEGAPPKKRKLRSDSMEAVGSDMEDKIETHNPFAILVEAAAVERNQISIRPSVRSRQLYERSDTVESHLNRTSREQRRKKPHTSTPQL